MLTSPLDALVKLQADMPAWLEKAEYLRSTAHLRYTEFAKLSEAASEAPGAAPPLKKKQASTESLRPQDDGEKLSPTGDTPEPENTRPPTSLQAQQSTAPTAPPAGMKINIDPRNRHLFREVREQRRKRKNPSLKDGQSGPQRTRSRLSMVIYYDSSIQDGFETLVRNISGARNILRKARTSASIRPQLMSMKEEESPWGRQGAYAYSAPNVPRLGPPVGSILGDGKTGLEVYTHIDRDLEAAQTLCEVGAHQALRDGDCFEELEDVKTYFQNCIKALDGEVANTQAQDEALRVMQGDINGDIVQSIETDPPERKPSVFDGDDPSAIAVDGPIEADDGEHDSIIVDLSEIPGRHQYSSKSQTESRTSSTSGLKGTQNSSFTAPSTQRAQETGMVVEGGDLFHKYTSTGADVPIDEAQAIAATVISVDADEAELNLSAMRNMVPRRRQEESPAPAEVKFASDEPEFDMAAMRKAALKKRVPPEAAAPATAATASEVEPALSTEPEFDFAAMKKSALSKRGPPKPAGTNASADHTPVPEPEFDFAAMKKSAIKKKGPPESAVTSSSPDIKPATEPEFDYAAMRKSAVKTRGPRGPPPAITANDPVQSASEDAADLSGLLVEPVLMERDDENNEKSALASAPSMNGHVMAQAV